MEYISTRGEMPRTQFSDVVLMGTAQDKGLVMPIEYPLITGAKRIALIGKHYREYAKVMFGKFATDIPSGDIGKLVDKTYRDDVFGSEHITPVQALDTNLYLEHLEGGPTFAFKDIALQFLGNLFEYVLERKRQPLNLLAATSGDTGSSAEYGVLGKKGISITVLSPRHGMSSVQEAQMRSIQNPYVHNIGVNGNFDDCQKMVKNVFSDLEFSRKYFLGSVNSINWARIMAQVVYYFYGHSRVANDVDEEVDFTVPTGNFGDVFAGWTAKNMGLPIRRLIVATNENDVLHEFFSKGIYRVRQKSEFKVTTSPSMDILEASNFERYLFDISGRDSNVLKEWMQVAAARETLDLTGTPFWQRVKDSGLVSGMSTHGDRVETIREVYGSTRDKYGGPGIIIDPHTADGIKVARDYKEKNVPMICLSTAHPSKFEPIIKEALGFVPDRPKQLVGIEELPQKFEVLDAGDVEGLKNHIEKVGLN